MFYRFLWITEIKKKIILFYYNSQRRNETIAPKKNGTLKKKTFGRSDSRTYSPTFVLQIISKDSGRARPSLARMKL
jgi:hypothetical protein